MDFLILCSYVSISYKTKKYMEYPISLDTALSLVNGMFVMKQTYIKNLPIRKKKTS